MNEKLIEIIIWVITQVRSGATEQTNINALLEQGFTDKEISTAFSWLTDKLQNITGNEIKKIQTTATSAYRFLSSEEEDIFTKDALKTIQQLQALGLLTNEHLDAMIERAFLFGLRKIDADMIKQYIAIFMFDAPPVEYSGSRTILHHSDSIN